MKNKKKKTCKTNKIKTKTYLNNLKLALLVHRQIGKEYVDEYKDVPSNTTN